jgi:hypothetical protein
MDSSSQTVFVVDNTSINEQNQNNDVFVYGGEGAIGIQFKLEATEHARIKVYTADGKIFYDEDAYVGTDLINIPMKEAAAEMYMVMIELPGRVYSTKVVLRK